MSTNDVPGAKASNRDVLAVGCWAEHDDGSLIFVEGVEGSSIIYSLFDLAVDPATEYRDSMPENGFKKTFSWDPKAKDTEKWTWHDKTSFPWDRIMKDFPAGQRHSSAAAQLSAAARVAGRLDLRAGAVRERAELHPTSQVPARTLGKRVRDAISELAR